MNYSVKNADHSKYEELKDTPRTEHADYPCGVKCGICDCHGVGLSSARDVIGRVAGGAIAKNVHELSYRLLQTKKVK